MKSLALLGVSALFLLSACGGDSDSATSPAKSSSADMEVATYEMLPSCAEKREGKTAYVKDQDQGYICQNKKWVESDDAVEVYPSSTSSSVEKNSISDGYFTDSRDGKKYRTVTIGTQTWMAENLNFKTEYSYCYNDSAEYCSKYGRLYIWAVAVGIGMVDGGYNDIEAIPSGNGVCPSGWHLPSDTEWNILINTVGDTIIGVKWTAGTVLKSVSGWYWYEDSNGTDAFSFSALPAGYRYGSGNFYYEGNIAVFWSSTQNGKTDASAIRLDDFGYAILFESNMLSGYSVRCLKD